VTSARIPLRSSRFNALDRKSHQVLRKDCQDSPKPAIFRDRLRPNFKLSLSSIYHSLLKHSLASETFREIANPISTGGADSCAA
jgi:hypothetical protein